MVDFGAAHGFNGIIIWGALRAHNQGEQQLKELAAYGREKGVRILPGCGIFSYGGVYYDPRADYDGGIDSAMTPHPYSLHTWLEAHPELRAVDAQGRPYVTGPYSDIACPSQPDNLAWFKEALAWLLQEFGVGGVQVEVGDYAVCHCAACTARRGASRNPVFCVEDMLPAYTAAIETARRVDAGAWVVCESYSSFGEPLAEETPGFGTALDNAQKDLLAALPEGALIQWVVDRAVGPAPTHRWEPGVYLPTRKNIARIHAGSQWSGGGWDGWAADIAAELAAKARRSGVNGAAMFGEESPASPPNEAAYLAFAEFSGFGQPNPGLELDLFYARTLDPLYGGAGAAREWVRLYQAARALRQGGGGASAAERQAGLIRLADEAHALAARLSGEPCRRWSWLENWLWRAEWLVRTSVSA